MYSLAYTGFTLWVYLLVAVVCIVSGLCMKFCSRCSEIRARRRARRQDRDQR